MKINTIKLTLFGAAMVVAASCQHSEPDMPTIHPSQPLGVSVGVDAVTRAVVTEQFGNGASINVIMVDPKGATATTDYGKSAIFTYNKPSDAAGIWVMEQGKDFLVTRNNAEVLAHYPSTLPDGMLSSDMRSIALPVRETADIGSLNDYTSDRSIFIKFQADKEAVEVMMPKDEIDYMTGSDAQQVGDTRKTAAIKMRHAQAMIALHVHNAPENTNRTELKSFSFQNIGASTALTSGSVALKDNAWTASSTTVSYTRTMSDFPIGTYFATLVSPATIAADEVELSVTVGEASYTFTLPAKEWTAGKIILYEVVVNSNSASLNSGVKVYDWDDTVIENKLELN